MKKNIHVVFPKKYMELLLRELPSYGDFNVIGTDYSFDNFYYYMTGKEEIESDTALIVDELNGDIPVEEKAHDFIKKLKEVRLERPHMRLIVGLPKEFEHLRSLMKNLVSLSVYDIHFIGETFSIEDLVDWLEKPKSLTDMKDFIVPHEDESPVHHEMPQGSITKPIENVQPEEPVAQSRIGRRFQPKTGNTLRTETKVIEKVVSVTQQNIAFVSLSKRSGSTFHATNFAAYLAKHNLNVGLYEYPIDSFGRTYLTDMLDLFNSDREAISIPHAIMTDKLMLAEHRMEHEGVTIYPVDYQKSPIKEYSTDMLYRYINYGRHIYKIFDLGYLSLDDEGKSFLQAFDIVYVVTTLSPLEFLPNYSRYEWFNEMAEKGQQPVFKTIINPYVDGIPNNEMKELNLHKAFRSPMLDSNDVLSAYFNKQIPYNYSREVAYDLGKIYEKMCRDADIPTVTEVKKKTGFLNKISIF